MPTLTPIMIINQINTITVSTVYFITDKTKLNIIQLSKVIKVTGLVFGLVHGKVRNGRQRPITGFDAMFGQPLTGLSLHD